MRAVERCRQSRRAAYKSVPSWRKSNSRPIAFASREDYAADMERTLNVSVDVDGLTVAVVDPELPRLKARFSYSGDRRWPQTIELIGFALGPTGRQSSKAEGLTVTAIRDLPVARWQAA